MSVIQAKLTPLNTEGLRPCPFCSAPCVDLYAHFTDGAWAAEIGCDCGVRMNGEPFDYQAQAIAHALQRWQARPGQPIGVVEDRA